MTVPLKYIAAALHSALQSLKNPTEFSKSAKACYMICHQVTILL